MAHEKTKTGTIDRDRVVGGEGYEVSYFAPMDGSTTEQVREFNARTGNDRGQLDTAAETLK
jgi:hypothetical protein